MKSLKKSLVLLIALALMTMLAACSSGTSVTGKAAEQGTLDPENPTTVTFYSYSLAYPTMKPGMEKLIADFNETVGKEKGVVVEGVADTDFVVNRADIAAGKQVDIIQHVFPTLDSSRQKLGFKAYEDVFPADELKVHFEGISENALELGKIDGKMYGMAFTFSTPIVFINGDLFEKAGLDPNSPPVTWEEIKAASLKIKEATGKDGFGLPPNNGWITDGVIYSNGGNILTEDRSGAAFASPEAVEAIEVWKDLYQNGAHAIGTDAELAEQFMAGNLGMYVSTTALYSGISNAAKAGGWDVYGAPLPQFGDAASVPVNSGSVLAVRPDSPEKNTAVWEFVKYVTGKEGYTTITEKIGYLPLRTELADDPAYLKDFVDANPLFRINLEQLERIRPVTIWPGEYASEASSIFTDAIVESVTTDADVEETMTKAQKEINELYGN